MLMVPCVGAAKPASARSRVVFPAPLSPRIACSLPVSNSAVTPRSAANRPNCLTTLETMMEFCAGVSITGEGDARTKSHNRYHSASAPVCEDSTEGAGGTTRPCWMTESAPELRSWPELRFAFRQGSLAVVGRTWTRTLPAIAWREKRRRARSCHRPKPGNRL